MFVEGGDLQSVPLRRLEAEITSLSAHIAAATCRFLLLVAEFDRREGWAGWGCASCAEWLTWRCGLAPRAAREHMRVAGRLGELQRVREGFARGELSFSQARAICRVADTSTEATLVEFARHSTAAQLERIVCAFRGVLSTELEEVNRAHERRYAVTSTEEDGSLVLHARLPAEEGATVLAALATARDHLREEEWDASRPGDVAPSPDPDGSAEPQVDPDATCGGDRRGQGDADALVLMAQTLLTNADSPDQPGGERHHLLVHVDAATLAHDDPAGRCHLDDGPALHPETVRRLACDASLTRIVERDGRPLSVGRRTRTIPPALRRALHTRDGGCRFPGCARTRHTDAHHVEHWAKGGPTDIDNLVTLCRRHHRLLHEGGYTVTADCGLRFHRPDGREIPQAPHRPRGDHRRLVRRDRRAGLSIDHATPLPLSHHPLDLHAAVDALAEADRRIDAERGPPG